MNPLTALMKTRLSTVMTARGQSANLITSAVVRAVRGSSCRSNTGARYTGSVRDGCRDLPGAPTLGDLIAPRCRSALSDPLWGCLNDALAHAGHAVPSAG